LIGFWFGSPAIFNKLCSPELAVFRLGFRGDEIALPLSALPEDLNELKGVVLGSEEGAGVGLPALGGVGGERVGVNAGTWRGAGRGLVGAGAGRKRDEVEGGLAEGSTFL